MMASLLSKKELPIFAQSLFRTAVLYFLTIILYFNVMLKMTQLLKAPLKCYRLKEVKLLR